METQRLGWFYAARFLFFIWGGYSANFNVTTKYLQSPKEAILCLKNVALFYCMQSQTNGFSNRFALLP